MLGVVGPGFIETQLNLDPHDLYIILLPGGIGLVAGVIVIGKLATPQNRLRIINFSMLAAGIALIVIASLGSIERFIARLFQPGATQEQINSSVLPWLVVSMMGVAFLLGALNSFIAVPAQTTLQDRSYDEIRARVFGAFYTIQNIIVIVPLILVGAGGRLGGRGSHHRLDRPGGGVRGPVGHQARPRYAARAGTSSWRWKINK